MFLSVRARGSKDRTSGHKVYSPMTFEGTTIQWCHISVWTEAWVCLHISNWTYLPFLEIFDWSNNMFFTQSNALVIKRTEFLDIVPTGIFLFLEILFHNNRKLSLLGKYTYSNWSNTEFSAATMKGWHTNLCSVPYFSEVFQLKKRIKKICHIYAMGYYSLVKKLTWNLPVTRKKNRLQKI